MNEIVEFPMPVESAHVTHEIAFSSYASGTLLVLCLLISGYGYIRTRKTFFALQTFGFLMMVAYYGISFPIVFNSMSENPTSLSLLLGMTSILGPAGIAFLGLAGIVQICQANSRPQSKATTPERPLN